VSKAASTVVSACFFCASLGAQTKGNISGFTKDQSGAMVPNVQVTITNERTGAVRTASSDETGFYQALGLTSGVYQIEAEAPGFKRFRNSGVTLTVDENVRADIGMEIGQVTDSIEVTAAAAMIDTRSSENSATIDDRRIVDLPLSGRNVFRLATTLPGVLNVSAVENTDMSTAWSGPRMNVNGGRANMNYNRFNGAYFHNAQRNTGLNVPPPDAIQEFRIQTSNFAADSGRNPGANVTVVSKQGTNEFHGAAWEFLRNDNLNARSFFQASKPQLIQNQYGAAAGGPIVRNKAFIFGAFEGTTDRRQATATSALPPTEAEVRGDFSSLNGRKQLVNPFDNTPFSNNQIPVSLFDPAARKILGFVPVVQSGPLQALGPNPRDAKLFMVRQDLNLTSKQNLFTHYYLNQTRLNEDGLAFSSDIAGWTGRQLGPRIQNAAINHTYTIRPTLLNQLTLAWTRSFSLDAPTVTRTPAELGIQNMPVYSAGSPMFIVNGRINLRSGGTTKFISTTYQAADHISVIHGRHTLGFGFEYMAVGSFQTYIGPPQFTFNGQRTGGGLATRGDPMADFLLGAYPELPIRFGALIQDASNRFVAGFLQDDFKIRPGLTLNLGLRYEIATPWVDKHDHINTVVPDPNVRSKQFPNAPPGMLFPGDLPRGLYNTDKNNFAPRAGFAWDVAGDGRTAVRGAWGIFYDTFNGDTIAQENPPFTGGRKSFFNGRLYDPFGSVGDVAPPAFIDPNAFTFVYPINGFWSAIGEDSLRTTYFQEWNFVIQREISRSYAASVAYIGKTGRKILAFRPFNAAPFIPGVDANGNPLSAEANAGSRAPFLPGIYGTASIYLDNSFTSAYHSFQAELTKRFKGGFQFNSSYVLSKSLDSSSTYTLGACLANPFDVRADRGRSDWDRRHAFVFSGIWSPHDSQQGLLGRVIGGWSLSGISAVQSGTPVTPVTGQNTALDGNICGGSSLHPDIVGNPNRESFSRSDMVANFFNRGAFVLPGLGRYGTAARGVFSGPPLVNTDLAVLKDILIREGYRFQFRAESSNVFNQVNFSNPVANLANAQYGRIVGSAAGRILQLGLKLLW
jgi:hypothetical protein